MEIEQQFIWVEGEPLPEVGEGAPVILLDNDPDFLEEFHKECELRLEAYRGAPFTERHIILEVADIDLIGAFAWTPKIPARVTGPTDALRRPVESAEALK